MSDDINQRILNQAQLILEHQERNKNLQRAAQLKEEYIHDLMGAHQRLINAIEARAADMEHPDEIAVDIIEILRNPPATVASEQEARLKVFDQDDQATQRRIAESAAYAKAKRLEGGE